MFALRSRRTRLSQGRLDSVFPWHFLTLELCGISVSAKMVSSVNIPRARELEVVRQILNCPRNRTQILLTLAFQLCIMNLRNETGNRNYLDFPQSGEVFIGPAKIVEHDQRDVSGCRQNRKRYVCNEVRYRSIDQYFVGRGSII